MKFIGFDIGSSSIKGAVLDLDSLTVGKTARVDCPEPIAGLPPFDRTAINDNGKRLVDSLYCQANCANLSGEFHGVGNWQ